MALSSSAEYKLGTFLLQRKISLTSSQPPLRIAYRIIRPSLLRSSQAPLLFIHGGPSLPSEYLDPIADTSLPLHNRSLILYDQLGCGWSSIPQQDEWYSVENMASDLYELLRHLEKEHGIDRYHLCGHSLGGAIGYEFLRRSLGSSEDRDMPRCLSFTLSNASTNFKLSDYERKRLFDQFLKQHHLMGFRKGIHDNFFQTHICRTEQIPHVLQSAQTRRGKSWSAEEYTALPLCEDITRFPHVQIIRGEYDFITENCISGWTDLIRNKCVKELQKVVMKDCAHYPHLEHPHEHAGELQRFCCSNE
jgi:proline iminopeptidase